MHTLELWLQWIGTGIEAAGVGVIALGTLITGVSCALRMRRIGAGKAYAELRVGWARSILLGLELLVAGDIIRTVVVQPTFERIALLGLVVLIRTFLSFTLELEVTGHWPWQRTDRATPEREV